MRILSFIPTFLLAAGGFVAAAPAAPAAAPVDTSCVSPSTGGNGNDAALQPMIAIIANATTYIQPLSAQLTNLKGDSCTREAVSGIVVQISAVVETCIDQLEATAKVDLTSLDLTNLVATISAHLTAIAGVLNALVTIVLTLRANVSGSVQAVICTLLDGVVHLVGCLKIFVGASVFGAIGPVVVLVNAVIELLLSIMVQLHLFLGVN